MIPIYTVKNVKSFIGMEGLGFNASLYRDNKKIGMIIDSAQGGCYDYQISKEEMKILNAHVILLPPIKFQGIILQYRNPDMFIGDLVEAYEKEKEMKNWCRKNIIVKLTTDSEGSWSSFKGPYTKERVDSIRKHYGNKVIEICNERF